MPTGSAAKGSWLRRCGLALAILTVVVPPFLVQPGLKEAFRVPKLFGSELLALGSLLCLLPTVGDWSWRRLRALPSVRAGVPLFACAALSLLVTAQPAASLDTLRSFAIGVATLVVWSLAIERPLVLAWATLVPAAGLAGIGLWQHAQATPPSALDAERLQLTSLAGSVGDFAAYLVLPLLLVQLAVWRRHRSWPHLGAWAALGALLAIAISVARTQVPLLAVAVGSLVLWLLLAVQRRRAILIGASLFVLAATVVLLSPAGDRLLGTAASLRERGLNVALSGRLDGWQTAWFMAREHPLLGVGHGAFGERYGDARLRMLGAAEPAATFHHRYPIFGNAHNDFLEVAAELGVLGVLALVAGIAALVRQLRRRWLLLRSRAVADDRGATALATAALAAYAVMACGYFPFRIALTAYPAIALFAWVLAPSFVPAATVVASAAPAAVPPPRWRRRALAPFTALLVAFALVIHLQHVRSRMTASRGLRTVEATTASELRAGEARPQALQARIEYLERLLPLDPSEVGIPLAIGSHFLLLQRAEPAIRWYRQALALEVRPELLANLGRAYRMAGDAAQAAEFFDRARRLDPMRYSNVQETPTPVASSVPGGG